MTDVEAADRGSTLTVPAGLVRGGSNFVLRVTGGGLEGEQIRDGDFVIVSPVTDVSTLEDGVLVLVETSDEPGKRRVRRLYNRDAAVCVLQGGNTAGLYLAEHVHIRGVVAGVIRRY
jgi:SOS-response transcriptional repressor LexA